MRNQKGMSLIEVLVALFLCSIVILAAVTFIGAAFTNTKHNKDKDFATQKAIGMLEELKSILESQKDDSTLLDGYDDGPVTNNSAVLTTKSGATELDAASGNIVWTSQVPGQPDFKYLRHITVQRLPGAQSGSIRLVNVQIFLNKDDDKDGKPDLLAEVAGVIQTVASNFPPTQVYDVYLLALENVPGWWVYMSNLIPFVQNAMADLQARNPGLEFRAHWITKLSYGRDQEYAPYVNNAASSTAASSGENVYWYPGRMPGGSSVAFYYPPTGFNARINVDGTITNGYNAATNPLPYALADQFNNAMRYPDELAYFNKRVAFGLEDKDTPTFRILLEKMATKPADFRNAIFINLHGELFPFPPVRNYSDPAKDPTNFPNVRVVTHPGRLRYRNDDPLNLRVYAYRTNPPSDENTPAAGAGVIPAPVDGLDILKTSVIRITIKGLAAVWNPPGGTNEIQAIKGGFDFEAPFNQRDPYTLFNADTTASVNGMYYTVVSSSASQTIIDLHNTPARTPSWTLLNQNATCTAGGGTNTCWRGLRTGKRLYGMEYVPSPLEDFTLDTAATPVPGTTSTIPTPAPFTKDLRTLNSATVGATCTRGDCAKNTARWLFNIPEDKLTENAAVTIETRIGADTCTGLLYPDPALPGCTTIPDEPTNLSRTYAWRGDDAHIFGGVVAGATVDPILPFTERYQILGDPRHLPYVDSKCPHESASFVLHNEDSLGMGYNRYFDDFMSVAGANRTSGINNVVAAANDFWPGWTYTMGGVQYGLKSDGTINNDLWSGSLEIDEHRIFQTYRSILMRVQSVYTTMSGFSYYYTGIGNEIGYDAANGFPNSIPVVTKPFTGVGGTGFENSITGSVKYIREGSTAAGYWWGINWLGELYPDSMYPSTVADGWVNTGNLPTGNAASTFVRVDRNQAAATVATSRFPFPDGTQLLTSLRRPNAQGSTTFFWIGTTGSTFHHDYRDNTTGTLLQAGTDVGTQFSYPIPDGVSLFRPFSTTSTITAYNPDHFLQDAYGPALSASLELGFYSHPEGPVNQGSSLLALKNPDPNNNDVAFVVVNGLSMTTASGTAFISRWSMLSLIESFLKGGMYNIAGTTPGANHIQQVPRIEITQPSDSMSLNLVNNPTSLDIIWKGEWLRWNGDKYLEGTASPYPAGFAENGSNLKFFVLVNNNEFDATTWKYANTNISATPGVRPDPALVPGIDGTLPLTNPYTLTWDLPAAQFPQGNYIVRVEAYRDDLPLHYAYHQYRVFIRR